MGLFSNDFKAAFTQVTNVVKNIIKPDEITKIVEGYYRPYQLDMWNRVKQALIDFKNGIEKGFLFVAGTGTGKTEIIKFISPYLISYYAEEAKNAKKPEEGRVFGIVCHRLCLIKDLGTRIIPTLLNDYDPSDPTHYYDSKNRALAGCGLPKQKIKFYYVNSGKHLKYDIQLNNEFNSFIENEERKNNGKIVVSDLADGQHINSLKVKDKDLQKEIEENRKNGIHSCFICLYQSIYKYADELSRLKFDWLICDEIHTVNTADTDENNGFMKFRNFVKNHVDMAFYFTATPQYDSKDTEMLTKDYAIQVINTK